VRFCEAKRTISKKQRTIPKKRTIPKHPDHQNPTKIPSKAAPNITYI
jgi:hypothetical protein